MGIPFVGTHHLSGLRRTITTLWTRTSQNQQAKGHGRITREETFLARVRTTGKCQASSNSLDGIKILNQTWPIVQPLSTSCSLSRSTCYFAASRRTCWFPNSIWKLKCQKSIEKTFSSWIFSCLLRKASWSSLSLPTWPSHEPWKNTWIW